jgi:hypothetical protein
MRVSNLSQSGFDKLAMCDNRRFDARQEEQPINKSNFLSEHGQHYLPL